MTRRVIDLTGQRFGRLLVVAFAGLDATKQARWLVRCDCGHERTVLGEHLRRGYTTSCGCLRREHARVRTRALWADPERRRQLGFPTEAMSRRPEYGVWADMRRRCSNPRNKAWKWYGARGVHVCPRWQRSFEAFLADMGERPSPRLTLQRVDNDRGYMPGNCRWATWTEQASNRRRPRPKVTRP
jgi:hypothetical protein